MNHVLDVSRGGAIRIADGPDELSAIHRPDCAAAIWHRAPLPAFQAWIDSLAPAQLPSARVILRPHHAREALAHICQVSGTPDGPERATLIDDAAALAEIYAGLMDAPFVRLRFDVIATDACRKFHIDVIKARLICTYRGTGTQYGLSTDGAEPDQIFTTPTGAPIMLRGKLWPEHPSAGLLHRSPPIEGTGETRLLLVLDAITDPDAHPEPKILH